MEGAKEREREKELQVDKASAISRMNGRLNFGAIIRAAKCSELMMKEVSVYRTLVLVPSNLLHLLNSHLPLHRQVTRDTPVTDSR